jgi:hypothetical protein
MIGAGKVDLPEGVEIEFIDCDCELSFPGYDVELIEGSTDWFRLVRKSRDIS